MAELPLLGDTVMADIYGKGAKGRATRLHALITRAYGKCMNCGNTEAVSYTHLTLPTNREV